MKQARFRNPLHLMSVLVWRLGLVAFVLLALPLTPSGVKPREWLAAGDRALQAGQTGLARKYYVALAEESTDGSTIVYDRLISLSLSAGDYEAARIYLYALVDRDGWTANRREQLRLILDHMGQPEMAQALVYASLDPLGDDPAILAQVADQQIGQQAWNELAVTLNRWLELKPDDANALYWRGLLLAPTEPAKAGEVLAQAALDPVWNLRAQAVSDALGVYGKMPMTEAHTRFGLALVGLEEWAFAERMMQFAIDANAVNPTALAYLSLARDQQNRDGGPALEQALALSPNDPHLRYLEGVHLRHVGNEQAAYDAFSQAYWLDPQNPALAAEAGVSLQHLSDLDGAEYWYQRAVALSPGDIQWLRLLAAFYADTGFKLDGTGIAFIEETSAAIDDADLKISLGWAYQQVGRTDQARTILSDALVRSPENWRGWTYLGMVFEQSGDPQAALAAYKMVLSAKKPDARYGLLASRAVERLSGTAP